ncbi:hypothetical protein Tco_1292551 [Tanacetum coccineum]
MNMGQGQNSCGGWSNGGNQFETAARAEGIAIGYIGNPNKVLQTEECLGLLLEKCTVRGQGEGLSAYIQSQVVDCSKG